MHGTFARPLIAAIALTLACCGDDDSTASADSSDASSAGSGTRGTVTGDVTPATGIDDGTTDGTTDGSTGGTTDGTAVTGDSTASGGSSTEGAMADSSSGEPDDGVVTFDEVQPIYAGMCSPCHTTASFGGHNVGDRELALGWADSQIPATSAACPGLSKGACTLVRVQSGSMPMGFGCSGDPATDRGDDGCLTQAQQDLVQAWIDDGELPPL